MSSNEDSFEKVLQINANNGQLTPDELTKFRQYLDFGLLFNRDYTWGYTSALLDILSLFERDTVTNICFVLKLPKNFKTIRKLLSAIIEDREKFKKYIMSTDLYFGYNEKTDKIYLKTGEDLKDVK